MMACGILACSVAPGPDPPPERAPALVYSHAFAPKATNPVLRAGALVVAQVFKAAVTCVIRFVV